MHNKARYKLHFKCHTCPATYKDEQGVTRSVSATEYKLEMSDNTCHSLECKHCAKPFVLEHLTSDHGYGWLHAGTHSRIISYKQV